MIKTDYFCRKLGSEIFEHSDEPKTIVPLKPKNAFVHQAQYFSFEKSEWIDCNDGVESQFGQDCILAEFADHPIIPAAPIFSVDRVLLDLKQSMEIEDYDENQMRRYIKWYKEIKRYKFNKSNFSDKNGIDKDWVAAEIESDDENLTLKIILRKFKRTPFSPRSKETIEIYDIMPQLEEKSFFFDLKNGIVELKWENEENDYDKAKKAFNKYKSDITTMTTAEKCLPEQLQKEVFKRFIPLARKFTDISHEMFCEEPPTNPLKQMCKITNIPYETQLCDVVFSEDKRIQRLKFKINRRDPNIFKKFCRKAKIQNTKTVRTSYNKRPLSLITYINVRDCGFVDINLYNKILQNEKYCEVFDQIKIDSLRKFCKYCIKKRGEKPTMNILLKPSEDFYNKRDTIDMFCEYFKYIPAELKKDILEDGFTAFNHDALANISYQIKNKNRTFTYTKEEKQLADSIGGFEFALPKDSHQLREIGTALHNCVANYAENVLHKDCTIVYVQKDGEYKVCIEVKGNEIIQERTNYNGKIDEETQKVLNEWHERHRLFYE